MDLNDQTLYKTASALKNRAGRSIMPGVVAIASALLLTVAFNFFINLYFIYPITKLDAAIRAFLKTGDRSGLRPGGRDEIGRLAASIEELTLNRPKPDRSR